MTHCLGGFIRMTRLGFRPSNPIMFNRYAYANNNPYKFADPNGREPFNYPMDNTGKKSNEGFSESGAVF